MSITERKNHLINWINGMSNESLLNRLEELKAQTSSTVPKEIISLLDSSNAAHPSELIEHTNARHLATK